MNYRNEIVCTTWNPKLGLNIEHKVILDRKHILTRIGAQRILRAQRFHNTTVEVVSVSALLYS